MGGLAVVVDWQRPVTLRELDPMLALTPHRGAGKFDRGAFEHAALAGTHVASTTNDKPLVTSGHLTVVGDLRLWNRDGLRSSAGGQSATGGLSDPRLILEAYRRTGLDFLSDIDGDFAFVIWDDLEQRVVAVRDRFATKPLFFERTTSGLRFASEPKQLVATSHRRVEPCSRSIAEYLTGHFQETRTTFFDGIYRIRPSMALIADLRGRSEIRYWNPSQHTVPVLSQRDIPGGFREQLTDSVQRRLVTSTATVSQLSGGLDSSAIAASAHILVDEERAPSPFHTASAVFPGTSVDESRWIEEIVARQPFAHHDFIPHTAETEDFEKDMWIGDQPRVNRARDMWAKTAAIAAEVGADLVFTGIGGDQVLGQDQLILDRLRTGSAPQRGRDIRAHTEGTGRSVLHLLGEAFRDALPVGAKQAIRRVLPPRGRRAPGLVRAELWDSLDAVPLAAAPYGFDFPSQTQVGVVAATQHPLVAWINEVQEAEYASRAVGLSQPYLDRDLVEYVASIPVRGRPYDGRSKTLTRVAYVGLLPGSVLDRRSKTVADDYLDVLFAIHGQHYRARYPVVSQRALPYVDGGQYARLVDETLAGPPSFWARESLWAAWTLMAWLDGLHRYGA